jgi:hypothetical protein
MQHFPLSYMQPLEPPICRSSVTFLCPDGVVQLLRHRAADPASKPGARTAQPHEPGTEQSIRMQSDPRRPSLYRLQSGHFGRIGRYRAFGRNAVDSKCCASKACGIIMFRGLLTPGLREEAPSNAIAFRTLLVTSLERGKAEIGRNLGFVSGCFRFTQTGN